MGDNEEEEKLFEKGPWADANVILQIYEDESHVRFLAFKFDGKEKHTLVAAGDNTYQTK